MELYENISDTEIVQRILKGEKSLYEIIVRRFNACLYKVGRSYNYNHQDTQDLMQDTFVDAFRSLSQFEGRSGFKTWIIRIMLNNCFRRKEKLSFKKEIMHDIADNSKLVFRRADNDTQRVVQTHELGHIIEEALAKIPDDYRIVFSLREINGLNVAEAADLLGISDGNVKVRLNRAKAMLRAEIKNFYAADELFEFNAVYCDAMVHKVMNMIRNL